MIMISLVYKYTDKYFCNRVEKNRVKPIRSIMSALNTNNKGTTGLSLKGTAANIGLKVQQKLMAVI
jgi:hypothetical protein